MSLQTISAETALESLDSFSAIIDARSPAEYAQDHLPGAVNWPTLDDQQRQQIGTEYKQVNSFEATKHGAVMALRNISTHIERELEDKPKQWEPLIYCWRGGKRSGSLGLILNLIGFHASLMEGGYKAFRAAMLLDLPRQVERLRFQVICGTTGTGKTRLLHALADQGAQVLDLEDLARHRGSVLGLVPGQSQPTQKAFDTLVWNALRRFSSERWVYVESESKKVGNVTLPDSLIQAMRASDCLRLELPMGERVKLLLQDYDFLAQDTNFFCERLATLVQLRGGDLVRNWQEMARGGRTAEVLEDLLAKHYDPSYLQSMQRNFVQYQSAWTIAARDHSHDAMKDLARQILAAHR